MKLFLATIFSILLSGCGSFVTQEYYEIHSASATVENHKQGHCVSPASFAKVMLGSHQSVSIESQYGIGVTVNLARGDTFRFTSSELITPNGWPASMPKPVIGTFSARFKPTDEMSLLKEYNQNFGYLNARLKVNALPEAKAINPREYLKNFQIRMPDAYLNGKLVTFPVMEFTSTKIEYYPDLCLK